MNSWKNTLQKLAVEFAIGNLEAIINGDLPAFLSLVSQFTQLHTFLLFGDYLDKAGIIPNLVALLETRKHTLQLFNIHFQQEENKQQLIHCTKNLYPNLCIQFNKYQHQQ